MGNGKKKNSWASELNGKTLGVIGCGYIGKDVERLALALGMKVIVVEECVYDRFVPLTDMLPQADFITIHVPLTPKTRHLLSTKEFDLMKKGVRIIDCSRGSVIDQEALYQALVSGKVAGAALGCLRRGTTQKQQTPHATKRDCYATYGCPNL